MRPQNPSRCGACCLGTALLRLTLVALVALPGLPTQARSATPAAAGDGEGGGLLAELFTPAARALFDELRDELRRQAAPLPATVRERLRPFFVGAQASGTELSPATLDQAVFVVDPAPARPLFALAPEAVAAITLGDVIVFPPGQYRPDCAEGLALIAHELVHVAQYRTLGRDRFLARYFLTETLNRLLTGALAGEPVDLTRNRLEIEAYRHQERVCRVLAQSGGLPPCDGRRVADCETRPAGAPSDDAQACGSPW